LKSRADHPRLIPTAIPVAAPVSAPARLAGLNRALRNYAGAVKLNPDSGKAHAGTGNVALFKRVPQPIPDLPKPGNRSNG